MIKCTKSHLNLGESKAFVKKKKLLLSLIVQKLVHQFVSLCLLLELFPLKIKLGDLLQI